MNKKRLGIDIDGTVTRPDAIIPYINKAFCMNLAYEDITEYDLTPFVNVPPEVFTEWYSQNESRIYTESPIAEQAKESLEALSAWAEFYFISARGAELLEVTEKWLARHGITYQLIELLGSHDKAAAAQKLQVDLFFEDKHDNAVQIAEECRIPVILFDTPYNRMPAPDGVIRVKNWTEAAAAAELLLKQNEI